MALKRNFNDEERTGMSQHEIELGEKYLREHKTAGAIDDVEALKLYEMYLIGNSFNELANQFPMYPIGQIILTAALKKWGLDRNRMQSTLRDRVQAKVVKSVIDQVDFLTSMLGVASAEHMKEMQDFILNPGSEPPPSLRIKNIKDYKEVVETLGKIIQGSQPGKQGAMSPVFDNLGSKPQGKIEQPEEKPEEKVIDLDAILEEESKKDK